jgi:hypothetical protein
MKNEIPFLSYLFIIVNVAFFNWCLFSPSKDYPWVDILLATTSISNILLEVVNIIIFKIKENDKEKLSSTNK